MSVNIVTAMLSGIILRAILGPQGPSAPLLDTLAQPIIGLCEAVILHHFSSAAFDDLLAYGLRMIIDFALTHSIRRFIGVGLWTFLGLLTANYLYPKQHRSPNRHSHRHSAWNSPPTRAKSRRRFAESTTKHVPVIVNPNTVQRIQPSSAERVTVLPASTPATPHPAYSPVHLTPNHNALDLSQHLVPYEEPSSPSPATFPPVVLEVGPTKVTTIPINEPELSVITEEDEDLEDESHPLPVPALNSPSAFTLSLPVSLPHTHIPTLEQSRVNSELLKTPHRDPIYKSPRLSPLPLHIESMRAGPTNI